MSDPSEPADRSGPDRPDADAWATACEEDLAEEKARRRAEHGERQPSAAEELRRLADAVSAKVAELGGPFGGAATGAAQGAARQFFAQAKAAVEPVVERNPQVFDHLAAAGGELLAAYRAAVGEAERRWTADGDARTSRPEGSAAPPGPASSGGSPEPADSPGSTGPSSGASRSRSERIDLDADDSSPAPGRGDADGREDTGDGADGGRG